MSSGCPKSPAGCLVEPTGSTPGSWRSRSARACSRRWAARSPRRATPRATIDDIVRGAGVSKKTFYDHFRDKEDCFLAAYEAAADELFARVREAQAEPDSWLERTRAGISAYLRWLAAEPALARVFLIEVAAAGPRAAERREVLRDRYAAQIAELQQDGPRGDPGAARAAARDLPGRRGGGRRSRGAAHPRDRSREPGRARADPAPPPGGAAGRTRGGGEVAPRSSRSASVDRQDGLAAHAPLDQRLQGRAGLAPARA